MNDKIGKRPKPRTQAEALRIIRKLARDKRGHLMLTDHCKWLELRLREISIMASRGLAANDQAQEKA